jgi:hypothetical protein
MAAHVLESMSARAGLKGCEGEYSPATVMDDAPGSTIFIVECCVLLAGVLMLYYSPVPLIEQPMGYSLAQAVEMRRWVVCVCVCCELKVMKEMTDCLL